MPRDARRRIRVHPRCRGAWLPALLTALALGLGALPGVALVPSAHAVLSFSAPVNLPVPSPPRFLSSCPSACRR